MITQRQYHVKKLASTNTDIFFIDFYFTACRLTFLPFSMKFKKTSTMEEINMNETLKILETRRSCRKFKPDMIPEEDLNAVIRAGTFAPTGRNLQSPIIIAVTNKELRDKISEENRKIGGWNEGFDPFYGAPVILIVLADKSVSPNYIYDGSLVMGNLMNAAKSLGLGSIWIHRAKQEFESDFGKKILSDLGIKGDFEGIGHVALGYAAQGGEAKAAPRKENYVYWVK